ncbi:ribosomal-processing cysteine protease Prp [Abyssisolibacter fermentans]|uniref:ribosomal-processing cysteine protease Prp n=1 Tax=Abyssisolibacter fermentans TaxID=1766203 RepID=UPI000834BAFE|nr:ribosomal-processing cysteine protease Prp [Abyssisolibacter fermentans]
MIRIELFLNSEDYVTKYRAKGHSGYEESGRDIICAAISILSYTALNSLQEVCQIDVEYKIDDDGFMEFVIPAEIDSEKRYKVNIVMDTVIIGIKSIIENYPEYVTLKYREV